MVCLVIPTMSASGIRIGIRAIAFAEPEVISPLNSAITNITAIAVMELGSSISGLEIALIIGSIIPELVLSLIHI